MAIKVFDFLKLELVSPIDMKGGETK